MVHLEHAPLHHAAVVRAVRLVHRGLALPAYSNRPIVFLLLRLQHRGHQPRPLAALQIVWVHRPRVGNVAGIGEDGAQEAGHCECEDNIKGDRTAQTVVVLRLVWAVEQRYQNVKQKHKEAPEDEAAHEEDGQPSSYARPCAHGARSATRTQRKNHAVTSAPAGRGKPARKELARLS